MGKTSDLLKVLEALELMADVEKSHDPKIKPGMRRKVQRRYFRNSVLIVAKDTTTLSRSGRNIPGVAVSSVSALDIETLAPGRTRGSQSGLSQRYRSWKRASRRRSRNVQRDHMNNLLYPIATEKAINMIERNNVITYIVDTRSSKAEIKKEFEDVFKVKVDRGQH